MNSISLINPKNLGEVTSEATYSDIYELSALMGTGPWSPACFTDNKRLIKNLRSIVLLVLDVDDGATLEGAKALFKDYKHIIATSRSHQKLKNEVVCDRFRVVLFLDSEITNDLDFKATWETAFRRWNFIDKACKDSSRFFYPSPEIISINEVGRPYPVSVHTSDVTRSMAPRDKSNGMDIPNKENLGVKGDLWKSTLDLLTFGAPAGHRHTRLVSAVGNMREQGYDIEETLGLLQEMVQKPSADWGTPDLNPQDIKTIQTMYTRENKYPYRPRQSQNFDSGVIVNAAELLDETFEYLADKDKVKGDPTGIEGLDKLLGGGFRTGELTVLMAQAKTGKNTLYHYLIYKCLTAGVPYGYASRELNPATEVIPNLLSIALQTNAWTNDVSDKFKADARQLLSRWPLFFAPGYGTFQPGDIEAWFRACKEQGVNHFLFDHFHYALDGEDYEATARLIKRLKALTKELDIHLSLIVQPRSLREGEQLSLATLRGGAAIGQALDNLLILERVRGEQANISRLKLDQARHKLATLGEIFLMYDKDTTGFQEVEKQLISEPPPIPQGIQRRSGGFNSGPWPRVT